MNWKKTKRKKNFFWAKFSIQALQDPWSRFLTALFQCFGLSPLASYCSPHGFKRPKQSKLRCIIAPVFPQKNGTWKGIQMLLLPWVGTHWLEQLLLALGGLCHKAEWEGRPLTQVRGVSVWGRLCLSALIRTVPQTSSRVSWSPHFDHWGSKSIPGPHKIQTVFLKTKGKTKT